MGHHGVLAGVRQPAASGRAVVGPGGRARTLVIGLLGFAVASAVGGAAGTFTILVAARAAQGVFAAILAPAALSALNVTFARPDDRAKAFAVYSAIAAGGAVLGLLLGGALTEWLSWRWCLYINLVFALPAAARRTRFGEGTRNSHTPGRGWTGLGAAAASGGLFCLVYGLSTAETDGWSAPLTVAMLSASAVLIGAFVIVEMRVHAPLLPLRIIADRNRGGAYLTIALTFCAMFAAFLFLTYFMQRDLRYSPLATGVAFLPMAAGIGLAAGLANTMLLRRVGPRPLIPTGMVLAAAGMAWLGQLGVDATYAQTSWARSSCSVSAWGWRSPRRWPPPRAVSPRARRRRLGDGQHQPADRRNDRHRGPVDDLHVRSRPLHGRPPPAHPWCAAAGAIHGYTVAFHIAGALFLAGAILTALILRSGRLQNDTRPAEPV